MKKQTPKQSSLQLLDVHEKPIHYSVVLDVLKRLSAMPAEDAAVISNKPAGKDQAADRKWRRRCKKYNIQTTPLGVSNNKSDYHKVYSLKQRIEKLEEDRQARVIRERQFKMQLTHAKLKMRDPVDRNTLEGMESRLTEASQEVDEYRYTTEWVLRNICDDCISKIEQAYKENSSN